ncbi:Ccc1 family [Xylaria intraflava]|nr:Ccc1 family [Xylaria intraflava]
MDVHASEYSAVPTTSIAPTDASSVQDGSTDYDRPAAPTAQSSLSHFLANFTLGFADGLTVPFALTAGLSSLGRTNTVIYAGLAEICAGCISMGIGGYLAAKGDEKRDAANNARHLDSDSTDEDEEKAASSELLGQEAEADNYLAPLQLPSDLLQSVMAHVKSSPEIVERMRDHLRLAKDEPTLEPGRTSPLFAGLTVALGYLLGGLIPLFPYFFVHSVTVGLSWSFGLCVVALFIFGFSKEYALLINSMSPSSGSRNLRRRLLKWDLIKHGIWEGIIMAALGGIAAVTAVVCVKLFENVMA